MDLGTGGVARFIIIIAYLVALIRIASNRPSMPFANLGKRFRQHSLFCHRARIVDLLPLPFQKEAMADKFEDLRVLKAVVSAGGFTAGAARLNIAKSAVSRRIRELEDRLGARLFDRTTRRVQLTETGREFHERAVDLLDGLERAEEAASSASGDLKGRIRVAAPVSFTTHCLVSAFAGFLEDHPAVTLSVDTDDRMVDLVRDGFDLAIRIARLPDSTLVARRLTTIRRVCVASPSMLDRFGIPRTPDDLSRFPGVLYSNIAEAENWAFAGSFAAPIVSRIDFANGEAVREAAIAGLGVAVLPTFIIHDAVRRGELSIILEEYIQPPVSIYAVHPSRRNQTARAGALIDYLADAFKGEPAWDRELFDSAHRPD